MANRVGTKEIEKIKNERDNFRTRLAPPIPQVTTHDYRGSRYDDSAPAYTGGARYQARRNALERRSAYKEMLNDRRKALTKKLISEK